LREVQEVLAEGEYRIGYYYYVKGDKRAAAARLLAVTNRYPLYSKSDQALWMMGDILEKSEHKEVAALYYNRIVKNYPLSSMVPGAKDKLKSFGAPIPQPDPNSLAWMTAEQNTPRPRTSLVKRPLSLISNGPKGEIQIAAMHGAPNLQPESDTTSPADILKPGGQSTLGGGTGLVATITPGVSGATGTAETVTPAAEGTTSDAAGTAPAASQPPADAATAPAGSAPSENAAKPPAAGSTSETTAKPDATAAGAETKSDAATAGTETKSDATDAAKTGDSQNSGDAKKESTSKKKKGLRKLVPW